MITKYELVLFDNGKYGVRRERSWLWGSVKCHDYFNGWFWVDRRPGYTGTYWESPGEVKKMFYDFMKTTGDVKVVKVVEELKAKK